MITLYLMSYKGFVVLNHIVNIQKNHLIETVVLAKDNAVINDYYNEIKEICIANNINYKHRNEPIKDTELSISISWRWMIDSQKGKLVVIHDSLLPKYRGFAPLVSALINGDKEIGATAILASKDYDKGNIISQRKIKINYPIKIKKAIELVSKIYTDLIDDIFDLITDKTKLKGKKQIETEATYSIWRDESDYLIDWNRDANSILRFINAVGYPYLGASTYLKDKKIRIMDAEVLPDVFVEQRENATGKIIFFKDDLPVIICGKGLLRINNSIFDSEKNKVLFKSFRTRLTNYIVNEV